MLKFVTGSVVTVTTITTRVQVSATDTKVVSVIFTADAANTGLTYVGDITVAAANGVPIAPGASVSIGASQIFGNTDEFSLADLYVDAATNGNKLRVNYLKVGR